MGLLFGPVKVLFTISFILLELGLTPLREIVVMLHLSCLAIIVLILHVCTSNVDCSTGAERPEQNGDDLSSSSDRL